MFCDLISIDINQVSNNLQKAIKNGIICRMTRYLDVLYVSGTKYRVRYRQNYLI